jgi:predicted RNA binding protein YcfA (HicA-like mRNA interferase family)
MPKIKVLSGTEIIKILGSFGFIIVNQRGSHVKLQRVVSGIKQTLTAPNHYELDRGTTKAIYNQVLRYIPEEKIRGFFYSGFSKNQ